MWRKIQSAIASPTVVAQLWPNWEAEVQSWSLAQNVHYRVLIQLVTICKKCLCSESILYFVLAGQVLEIPDHFRKVIIKLKIGKFIWQYLKWSCFIQNPVALSDLYLVLDHGPDCFEFVSQTVHPLDFTEKRFFHQISDSPTRIEVKTDWKNLGVIRTECRLAAVSGLKVLFFFLGFDYFSWWRSLRFYLQVGPHPL